MSVVFVCYWHTYICRCNVSPIIINIIVRIRHIIHNDVSYRIREDQVRCCCCCGCDNLNYISEIVLYIAASNDAPALGLMNYCHEHDTSRITHCLFAPANVSATSCRHFVRLTLLTHSRIARAGIQINAKCVLAES